jgi:hypothetical protein
MESMSSLSRRTFLNRSLLVPLAGTTAWALSACGSKGGATGGASAAAAVCADPRKLTAAENAQRQSFHYVEQSTDQTKTCSGCSFFTPSESGTGCGQCQVLLGPANPRGHCDSWAAKAG